MIFNLINNARWAIRKKSDKDSGIITVKTYDIPGGRSVCIIISDTGCGVASENQEKIFGPFFTTKPAGEGIGLGLAVVNNIVKAHGGSITLESQPGAGASFIVKLPAL
jgi:signal transduction histidine kinase